ncbi:MAG: hypothetical protein B1H08_05820, partial [Candidatus Omnitrophica bacterium 4484_171]
IQNSIYAQSNDGNTIDVHYVSQIYVDKDNLEQYQDIVDPSKEYKGYDVLIISSTNEDIRKIHEEAFKKVFGQRKPPSEMPKVEDKDEAKAAITKFVTIAKEDALTPVNLRDLGMYGIEGNIARFNKPKGSFKSKEEVLEWLQRNGLTNAAYSCGSHRLKREFMYAIFDYFREDFKKRTQVDKSRIQIEAPDFIQPILILLEGLRGRENIEGEGIDRVEDVINFLPQETRESLTNLKYHREVIDFWLKNKDQPEFRNNPWVGVTNIGSNIYWWRYRRPAELYQDKMQMIAKFTKVWIEIDAQGRINRTQATEEQQEESEAMLKFRGIKYPITNSYIGKEYINSQGVIESTQQPITFEDIEKGITIGGVYIKNSIIQNSYIKQESSIIDSVISNTAARVDIIASYIQDSVIANLEAEHSIIYNVVEKEKLKATATCCADIYREDILKFRDLSEGQARIWAGYDADGKKDKDVVLKGNIYTFGELSKFKNNPLKNNEIKNRIAKPIEEKIKASSSIVSYRKEQGYLIYTLRDTDRNSSFSLIPSRGATITSFKAKDTQILYCPDITKSGGIPILWPYANRIRNSVFTFQGKTINLKGVQGTKDDGNGNVYHGMVRYESWEVEEIGQNEEGIFIRLALATKDYPNIEQYFGKSKITLTYILKGTRLIIRTYIENKDNKDLIMSLAYHPWFNTPDKDNWQIQIPANSYWPSQNQLPIARPISVEGTRYDLRHLEAIGKRRYDDVLTNLEFKNTLATSILKNQGGGVTIILRQDTNFKHIVLYIPEDKDTVCIEPQTSSTDAFNMHNQGIKESTPIILKSQASFTSYLEIEAIIRGEKAGSSKLERAPPKASSAIVLKKAPGTEIVSNEEAKELLDSVKERYKQRKSHIEDIPAHVKEFIKQTMQVDEEEIEQVGPEGRDPATFKERLSYMLDNDMIKFIIDDLGKDKLYPRQKAALGALSFSHEAYVNGKGEVKFMDDVEKDKQKHKEANEDEIKRLKKEIDTTIQKLLNSESNAEELLDNLIEQKEELKAKEEEFSKTMIGYKPRFVIHMTEAVWDGKKQDKYFLSQLIIHEATESIMGSPEGITPHQHGVIREMDYLSPFAKRIGISDINYYILKHAAQSRNERYFHSLLAEYRIERDPTMGKFYEVAWKLVKDFRLDMNFGPIELPLPELKEDVLIHRAPATEDFERRELQWYYGKGKKENIPEDVINLILEKQVGRLYDELIHLIIQGRMYFKIDKVSNSLFYKGTKDRELDAMFFVHKVKEGKINYYEVHMTKSLWEKKKKDAAFLAQILVFSYTHFFIPQKDIDMHDWARLMALRLGSREAVQYEVNDLDLEYLDYAAQNNMAGYFYKLLKGYRLARDPQGTFKLLMYKKMQEIGENKLLKAIKEGRDLLAYYMYLFEFVYKNETQANKVIAISKYLKKIEDNGNNGNVKIWLNDERYFFKYNKPIPHKKLTNIERVVERYKNEYPDKIARIKELFKIKEDESQKEIDTSILYIPENIGAFIETSGKLKEEINAIKKVINGKEYNDIEEFLNDGDIKDKEAKEKAQLWDEPFIDYIAPIIEKELKDRKNVLIVGFYGPSSAGKTTLTDMVKEHFKDEGIKTDFISSDSYLHSGGNLRYIKKKDGSRFTIIKGPAIYHLKNFARDLLDLKQGKTIYTPYDVHGSGGKPGELREIKGEDLHLLLIDLTVFGIDKSVLEQIDILVPVVFTTDKVRLDRRLGRDVKERGMAPDPIITDMVEKQIQELYGAMYYYSLNMPENTKLIIWDQYNHRILVRKTSSSLHSYKDGPIAVADLADAYSRLKFYKDRASSSIREITIFHFLTEKRVIKSRFVLIFKGPDWNHHSFQAAYKAEHTLFIILVDERADQNVKLIAYATYQSLSDNKVDVIYKGVSSSSPIATYSLQ